MKTLQNLKQNLTKKENHQRKPKLNKIGNEKFRKPNKTSEVSLSNEMQYTEDRTSSIEVMVVEMNSLIKNAKF